MNIIVHGLRAAITCLLIVAWPVQSSSAQSVPEGTRRFLRERKGIWKIEYGSQIPNNVNRVPVISPAERRQMIDVLDAVSALLQATPAGTALKGIAVNDSRNFDYPNRWSVPIGARFETSPLEYDIRVFPHAYEEAMRQGQWKHVWGETESIAFFFNRLPGRCDGPRAPIVTEPGGEKVGDRHYYLRPQLTEMYNGMTMCEGYLLLVTRPGRDPWAAAEYGKVLRAMQPAIEDAREGAETSWSFLQREDPSLRGKEPPRGQFDYWEAIDNAKLLRDRLAQMTPREASGPACMVGGYYEGEAALSARNIQPGPPRPDCIEIVTDNPAYFDASLPRTAPQLMHANIGRCIRYRDGKWQPEREPLRHPNGCDTHVEMWRDLDWAKLRTLVVR